MYYYKCARCNHITKQKIDMKRHLDKKNACININNSINKCDFEFRKESLTKNIVKNELKNIINNKSNKDIIENETETINNNDTNIIVESHNNNTVNNEIQTKNNNEHISILENIIKDKNIIHNKSIDILDNDLKNEIIVSNKKNNNKHECERCNWIFHNKSNLNKHIKQNKCKKNNNINENTDNNIKNIKNIQNIGVQNNINNIFNININSLRGFDEDWNIANISHDIKEKIFLSDKKFINTLENILNNSENLNVILKDNVNGLVYKIKNNEYEIMPVKDILEESMNKIYKHLRDFFTNIVNNNKNDIRMDILENELKEADIKYNNYKKSITLNSNVNKCLSNIFDDKKIDCINQFMKINNDEKYIDDYKHY